MNDSTILIIGKQGKTGARVESRLLAAGIATRGVSRSTNPAFDWQVPQTWPGVFDGVRAAYVTYHPDLAVPQALGAIRDFTRLAHEAGVEHIVLLSGRGEDGAKRAEDVLRYSGIDWNVIRASWFAQNFSENFMLDGILAGELVMPSCDVPEPFIDADDIADVAVAALLEPGLRNRLFEVTGPQLMTFAECAAAIAKASGYPVNLLQVPLDDYLAALADQGVPPMMCSLLEGLFTDLFDGRNAAIADGVREALGRPPIDFETYARKTAATGVWNRASAGRVA